MDSLLNFLNIYTTTIAIISLISFFSLFLFRSTKVNKEAPIVGGAWPILGHLPLISRTPTPHRTLGTLADKYRPIFTIKLGSKRALVLNNSEITNECFTKNDIVVSSRPKLAATEHLAYNGAMLGFAPYGTYWRELRKIIVSEFLSNHRIELLSHVRVSEVQTSINELFNVWCKRNNNNNNDLQGVAQVVEQEHSNELVEEIENSNPDYVLVELKEWFACLTFNMVLRMIVGKRFFGTMDEDDEKEAKRCLKSLKDLTRLMGVFTMGDAIPCLRWFDLGGYEKAMKESAKELDNVLFEWLEEHRGKREKDGPREEDFMDVMLSVLDRTIIDEFDVDTIHKSTTLVSIYSCSIFCLYVFVFFLLGVFDSALVSGALNNLEVSKV